MSKVTKRRAGWPPAKSEPQGKRQAPRDSATVSAAAKTPDLKHRQEIAAVPAATQDLGASIAVPVPEPRARVEFVAAPAQETSLREVKMARMRETNMGPLTRDMARLHDEIVSAKNQRRDLMANVKRSSDDRKEAVRKMETGFHAARMEMKTRMAQAHATFLGNLQKHVGALRNDMANDLAGARRAFAGGRG